MSRADDGVADTGYGDAVLYEVNTSGVAVLTLNRPERLDTWRGDIATVFYANLDRAEQDQAVRVIVLTGRGKAFCAGAQLGSMETVAQSSKKTAQWDLTELVGEQQPYYLTTLCKPVIAAINDSCVGIGLTQALMCDVRFAARWSEVRGVVRAPRIDRRVRHLVDTSALDRLGCRTRSVVERPDRLRRRGGRTGPGQGSGLARTADAAGHGLRRGHRPKLLAGIHGRHQAAGLR